MALVTPLPDLHVARALRVRGPLAVAAAVAVGALALHVRDPHEHGSWGLCPFKAITGWDCPMCGGLRSVNDLGHGQLVDAAHSNLMLVASLPVVVVVWTLWVRRSWAGSTRQPPVTLARPLLAGLAVVVVAFTIYRNTPWGSDWHVA